MKLRRIANKNEIIWLSVKEEVKIPIATYIPARKKSPINEPQNPPTSIFPIGLPRINTEMKYISVGNKEKITRTKPARYLARITSMSLRGFVKSSSIVPVLLSSENMRIVMAGIRKRNTHGAIKNKVSSDA